MMSVPLREIRSAMRYSENDFASMLGLSVQTLDKTRSVRQLRLDQLTKLADHLQCSVETFARGFFDIEVVQNRYSIESHSTLPARYRTAAFSKARTSISLFQFIEHSLGRAYSERVLKALQVDPSLLEHYDQSISMQLVIDTATLMKDWGVSPDFLKQMGSFSASTNREGPVGEFFRECRTATEAYEKMIPILGRFFEMNHDYKILSLTDREVFIESKTSQLVQDSLKLTRFGSASTCEVRRGVAASFPQYLGLKATASFHPECMHRGDGRCVYHVTF